MSKNAMIEREVCNVSTFKNKFLAEKVAECDKAVLVGKKASIVIAKNVVAIVEKEAWKDDFKTQSDFARFMGTTNNAISTWKKAVEYNRNHPDAEKLGYSIRRSYEYQSMEEAGTLDAFHKWVLDNKAEIGTDGKLLKAIAGFNGKALMTKEEKAEAIDAEVKEKAKAGDYVAEGGVEMVALEYNGSTFSIPKKEMERLLKKYGKNTVK